MGTPTANRERAISNLLAKTTNPRVLARKLINCQAELKSINRARLQLQKKLEEMV
tara:strand:+ start:158 stop:322 length:165 start_codon:yes stop_codon:yes gene_type:complete